MRKHKSVVAILLAVMMIFTFMPTMAFADGPAADKVEWKGNCDTLVYTSSDGSTTATYADIVKTQRSDGMWEAKVDTSKYSSVPAAVADATAYFWDLNGAKLGYMKDGSAPTVLPENWTWTDWNAQENNVKENAQAAFSVKTKDGFAPVTKAETASVWQGVIKGYSAYDADNNAEQTLTLSYDVSWTAGATISGTSASDPFVFGTPDPVTVKVAKKPVSAADIKLYYDEVKTGNEFAAASSGVAYDGAAHTVVATPVEGFTTSFKVYQSGSWIEDQTVSVTNVGDEVTFQVVVKDAKGNTVTPADLTGTKTAKVAAANVSDVLNFGFVATTSKDASYKVAGAEFDAYEWVEIWTRKTASDSAKAAIEANKADIMAVLKAVTKVKTKVDKDNANLIYVAIGDNDATDKEIAELNKTYDQLLKNLGFTSVESFREKFASEGGTQPDHYADAEVLINYAEFDGDFEIEFTNTLTTKTYKGKQTTKKGTLKKNQKIAVTATAANGTTLKFKLINAPKKIVINKTTGQITVKKGITKGTYKIKVKAYVPGYSDYVGASEVHNITIKVKK